MLYQLLNSVNRESHSRLEDGCQVPWTMGAMPKNLFDDPAVRLPPLIAW